MDPRISSVFRRDIKYIEDLVSVMMTSSHELHPEAEEIFNLCKQTDPNQLALRLANLLEESKYVEVRATSAILLGEMFEETLDVFTQNLVKYILLRCVEKERDRIVMKSLCHTIAEGFNEFLIVWPEPELVSFLCRCVSSHKDLLQESAMLILGSYMGFYSEDSFFWVGLYNRCLRNADSADVRIAAFGGAISFFEHTYLDPDIYFSLTAAMKQVLSEGLEGGQEVMTQETLKLLIERAKQESPGILESVWFEFVGCAFEIAESQSLEKETKHLAIDFMITLGERGHSNRRYMINRLFGFLMFMLSDIENENDAASHWPENEDDDAWELRNYSVVQEFLDRLTIQVYGGTVVGLVLEQYLAASEWQKRVAAIVALAQISEVYLKVTKKSFDQFVTMVLDLFQDHHPRVRLAAINAIGQLSTDLDPGLQFQYYHRVLPALATTIYDFQYPRVQAHAASAMVYISKNCPPDILTRYLHDTVSTLLQFVCARNDLASDETRSAINLLKKFRQKLPSVTWASTWPTLHPHLLVEWQSILSS